MVEIPTARFCSQCGARLNPGVRFCGQCGQPLPTQVQTPQKVTALSTAPLTAPFMPAPEPVANPRSVANPLPPPVTAPQNNPEVVLGILPFISRRKGLFGSESFNLVITPYRLIFAQVTTDMMQASAQQSVEAAKEEGKGWIGRTAAAWSSRSALWQRYFQMPVEAILAEQPGNFFVLVNQVKQARIDAGYDPESTAPDTLTIESTMGKQKFNLGDGNSNDARKLLQQVLGKKVK